LKLDADKNSGQKSDQKEHKKKPGKLFREHYSRPAYSYTASTETGIMTRRLLGRREGFWAIRKNFKLHRGRTKKEEEIPRSMQKWKKKRWFGGRADWHQQDQCDEKTNKRLRGKRQR